MKISINLTAAKQSGSVLIISMIVLLVLTFLGISGIRSSTLEEKMAGNLQNQQLAFQAAEATLSEAEKYIELNIVSLNDFDTDGTDGLYNRDDPRIWENINWNGSDSLEYSGFDNSYSIKTPPRFIIQHLVSQQNELDKLNLDNYGQGTGAGRIEVFLITARAAGSNDNSHVMLQTTYGKRL